jgi:two-component system OmpR family response regulator
VLRRTAPEEAPASGEVVTFETIRLDVDGHRVFVAEAEITLTVTEFRLLEALLRRPGKAFTRAELVRQAYDGPHFVSDRTVDSHIRGVRTKLRDAGVDVIETVHGLGYRLRKTT